MKKWVRIMLLLVMAASAFLLPGTISKAAPQTVYKVPVHKEVEKGLYAFLQRSFAEAGEAEADAIILDIDTLGGFTDAASQIGQLFDRTEIPIIAYIDDRAISAGAFIALHADQIYMAPAGTIGAAQAIVADGNAADVKGHSLWVASMINAAESSKRKTLYAEAMAEPKIDLPEYRAGVGKLLTLRASEAEEVGYSEGTASTFDEVLSLAGFEGAKVISVNETFAETLTRYITHPVVVPILLSIAGLGLVVELYSPGFGVAGTMGLTALFLFFFGHFVAGLAGYETLILFIIGAGLVITEFFVAGGIAGVAGSLAIIGSIIMAGGNPMYMSIAVLIAIAVAAIGMVIIMKFFGKKLHLLNKMILMDATDTESGYVSNVNRVELLGRIGKATTPLRPSGTIDVANERIDVVSQGNYIDKGKNVIIIKVEGSRIVVRETDEKEENNL